MTEAYEVRPETLLTAAKRVVRFIRIDDQHDGGLLSRQTIDAGETLAREIEKMEARIAKVTEPQVVKLVE